MFPAASGYWINGDFPIGAADYLFWGRQRAHEYMKAVVSFLLFFSSKVFGRLRKKQKPGFFSFLFFFFFFPYPFGPTTRASSLPPLLTIVAVLLLFFGAFRGVRDTQVHELHHSVGPHGHSLSNQQKRHAYPLRHTGIDGVQLHRIRCHIPACACSSVAGSKCNRYRLHPQNIFVSFF